MMINHFRIELESSLVSEKSREAQGKNFFQPNSMVLWSDRKSGRLPPGGKSLVAFFHTSLVFMDFNPKRRYQLLSIGIIDMLRKSPNLWGYTNGHWQFTASSPSVCDHGPPSKAKTQQLDSFNTPNEPHQIPERQQLLLWTVLEYLLFKKEHEK